MYKVTSNILNGLKPSKTNIKQNTRYLLPSIDDGLPDTGWRAVVLSELVDGG